MAQQVITKAVLNNASAIAGKGMLVAATVPTGTTIHTAVSTIDEVFLYATNNHSASVVLTIEWDIANGAATHNTVITIPNKSGRFLIVDGRLITNAKLITAFAATSNVIFIDGFVNQIV